MCNCTLSTDQSANRIHENFVSPSAVQNAATAETSSSRLVEVCLSRELAEYLSRPGLHPMARLQIIDIATINCGKVINQRLLTKSIGRRAYDKFVAAARELESLGLMQVDWRYQPNLCSRSFSILFPTNTEHADSAQHRSGSAATVGIWLIVDLGLLDDCLSKGRKKLNWLSVEATCTSLTRVTLENVPNTDDELVVLAQKHIKEKTPRINPDELIAKADHHVAAIRKAERNPAGGKISRKSGRIYHRLNNLPKWARKLFVRICGEVPVNVDIRACYLWCLLSNLRRSRIALGLPVDRLDAMLDMVESGKFYEKLATLAELSTVGAKASFATLCLFGGEAEHFANNRLWIALQKLCPAICTHILRLRERHGGASGFAKHCQRLEGAIMLDGLLMTLHDVGIPCVGLHDGALVQPEHRQLAIDIIKARSFELFGRSCHVSG